MVLRFFKLLLIDEADLPANIRNSPQLTAAKNLLRAAGKMPVEVIGDYLRLLWKHSMQTITKSIGKSLLDISKFHIVVTLPAIWPMYSQIRMREAVELAGILEERNAGASTLSFMSEPEAAAMATMDDMAERPDLTV